MLSRSRSNVRISAAVVALLVLVVAIPALADYSRGSGERVNLTQGGPIPWYGPDRVGVQFAADEAFHIAHGWDFSGVDGCIAFRESMGYTVEILMDGVKTNPAREVIMERRCWQETWYLLDFRQGLTGTHTFQLVFHFPLDSALGDFWGADSVAFRPVEIEFVAAP